MRLELPLEQDTARRASLVRSMITLSIIAMIAMYLSSRWDAAEHAKGAVDRFWYPPHFGIYFGLLTAGLLALVGLILLLGGPGLPLVKLRQNAALALVVAANGLSFIGAPFDAWWHTTFGIDLTVWSPPHLHLLLGTLLSLLASAVYFLDNDPADAPLRPLTAPHNHPRLIWLPLTLALLLSGYLFIEYEGGRLNADVLARPLWTFPIVWSFYVLFTLGLLASFTRRIGMVTVLTTLYLVARLGMLWLDRAVFDFQSTLFYPLIIPALAFDLLLMLLRSREDGRIGGWRLVIVGVGVAAVVALSTWLYWRLIGAAPALTVAPWTRYWPLAVLIGAVSMLGGWWSGTALRRLRPAATATAATIWEPRPALAD